MHICKEKSPRLDSRLSRGTTESLAAEPTTAELSLLMTCSACSEPPSFTPDAMAPFPSLFRLNPPPTPTRLSKQAGVWGRGSGPQTKFGGPHPPTLNRRAHTRETCVFSVQADLLQLVSLCWGPAGPQQREHIATHLRQVRSV